MRAATPRASPLDDVVTNARAIQANGAACISVLVPLFEFAADLLRDP